MITNTQSELNQSVEKLPSKIAEKVVGYSTYHTLSYVCNNLHCRAVVKSTFVESKTSPSPKRFESESSPSPKRFESESSLSPKRFESESSPSPNETVKTEKEKNLLHNHILNY